MPTKKKCSVNDNKIDKIGHQVSQLVAHAGNDGEDISSDESDEDEKKPPLNQTGAMPPPPARAARSDPRSW